MSDSKRVCHLCLFGTLLTIITCCLWPASCSTPVLGHYSTRGLLLWKRDLELRLDSYRVQRQQIESTLGSSPLSPLAARGANVYGPQRPIFGRNIQFSELIIPSGSLVLEDQLGERTLRHLANRTQSYMRKKLRELDEIKSQYQQIRQHLSDPAKQLIYKAQPGSPLLPAQPIRLRGTRIFKHLVQAHAIRGSHVALASINGSSVDKVLDEAYRLNLNMELYDSQKRLYFEGRKTVWSESIFSRPLKSGCCDRLRPLHTDRMMTRLAPQEVRAPVLLGAGAPRGQPVRVRSLQAHQLVNARLEAGRQGLIYPASAGLSGLKLENKITVESLVRVKDARESAVLANKVLVFKDSAVIEEAHLARSIPDNRLLIGVASEPRLQLDLAQDNYLLKYQMTPNGSVQRLKGSLVINSRAAFLYGVDAYSVNNQDDFGGFVRDNIVTVNQPATIYGPVQFVLSPAVSRAAPRRSNPFAQQTIPLFKVDGQLEANTLNGLAIPQDIIVTNLIRNESFPFHVRAPCVFSNGAAMANRFTVRGMTNSLRMPQDVIPLHLNDAVEQVGAGAGAQSNLWLVDGIHAHDIAVHSQYFDDIPMRASLGTESLVTNMMLKPLGNDTNEIRAPLQVERLHLIGGSPRTGLLNGFRPEDVIELEQLNWAADKALNVDGDKLFRAGVEADECEFGDINNFTHWTSHLIRIDRPDTQQTVHSRLAFLGAASGGSVRINRLHIGFLPNNSPFNYQANLNLAPQFYMLYQALEHGLEQNSNGRVRVLHQVRLLSSGSRVNGIQLADLVRLDEPFRFADRYVLVGKVKVEGVLKADQVVSNYPLDVLDLVQFNRFRVPIAGNPDRIQLNNLVLSTNNRAPKVTCNLINGVPLDDFASSVMSLTRAQVVRGRLTFMGTVHLEGLMKTNSSVNGYPNFRALAQRLQDATAYVFQDGLQSPRQRSSQRNKYSPVC